MKKGIKRKLLEKLEKTAVTSVEFFCAYLRANYGASYGKMMKELEKVQSGEIEARDEKSEEFKKAKKRFNRMVYYLKEDGLVDKKGKGDNAVISITAIGRKESKEVEKGEQNRFPSTNYSKVDGKKVILVSFDIPEKYRAKRNWLRKVLENMGFELLHQSVYLGRRKLPADFVNDLKVMGLIEFVEIIEINNPGTLRRVLK